MKGSFGRFLLMLLLLGALITHSPIAKALPSTFWGGFKGGVNLAGFGGDGADEFIYSTKGTPEMRLGPCFGVFGTLKIHELFAVQSEILYLLKGAKYEVKYQDYNAVKNYQLDYLEVPLLAKLTIPLLDKIEAGIYAGPSFGIFLSGNTTTETRSQKLEEGIESSEVNTISIGAAVGANFYYDIGGACLFLDFRYIYGLTPWSGSDSYYGEKKHNTFGIMAGLAFPLN